MSEKGDQSDKREKPAILSLNPVVFIERDLAKCSKCQSKMFRLGEDLWECFGCGEIERHN